ncbi:MAG TPA: STAS domain-containing protein [Solirubrobacteraceae bacterium]|nr:STAS domain-containing protein [Solirubrobacteraceae bacterium]
MTSRFAGIDVEEIADAGRYTLVLSGELELGSANTLQAAITRVCAGGLRSLTIDLRKLMFIDSTGLAVIILASKICERDGHDFALIPGPRAVQRLFEITGLIDVLPFREAAADAQSSPSE